MATDKKYEPLILIVDRSRKERENVRELLQTQGFSVLCAASFEQGRELLEQGGVALAIVDVATAGGSAQALQQLVQHHLPLSHLVVTGAAPHLLQPLEHSPVGAFFTKPFALHQLKHTIAALLDAPSPRHDGDSLQQGFGLVGSSRYMRTLRQEIARVAAGEFPVLIEGESGTGKELVAQAIHNHSKRHEQRLVSVNCAALTTHPQRTPAADSAGLRLATANRYAQEFVAHANGSTLFLDAVGESSLEVQTMLLELLDNGEFMPIDRLLPLRADVRIVSATNRDLEQMVQEGRFRKDLYFRLKGARIQTRALEHHREDIPLLLEHFLTVQMQSGLPRSVSPGALSILMDYPWPGNIRELKYTAEVLSVAAKGYPLIDEQAVRSVLRVNEVDIDTPLLPLNRQSYHEAKATALQEFELRYFTDLLVEFRGNVSRASKAADMYRANFLDKLKRICLNAHSFRQPQ
jgi:DNA-binding NtrC family response regulator